MHYTVQCTLYVPSCTTHETDQTNKALSLFHNRCAAAKRAIETSQNWHQSYTANSLKLQISLKYWNDNNILTADGMSYRQPTHISECISHKLHTYTHMHAFIQTYTLARPLALTLLRNA